MKNKIHKLLGVALTAILLITMTISLVAVPASAKELAWGAESLPSTSSTVNQLVSGVDVTDFAVAPDGNTIFAVAGTTTMYKSTNGGTTWTRLTISAAATLVAIAPDDANVIAYVAGGKVYASSNGGTSFSDLGQDTDATPLTSIYAIDISPTSAGAHNIAVGGSKAGPAIGISYFNLGASVPKWTDADLWATAATADLDATTACKALKFSPAFASDKVMVAVTETDAGTDIVYLEIASFASKHWNDDAGFTDYTGTGHQIINDGTAAAAPLQSASIALFPTYLGADEAERKGFVGLATAAADATILGGIYRMSDEADKLIGSASRINSVDYTTGEKLVAGRYDSNTVNRSANPLATSPTVSSTSTYQKPGGENKTVVAFVGNNVAAATSGDESAFAISNDDGKTFNDVSLIDTTLETLSDFAVSADGSTLYLTSLDAGGETGYLGKDVSIWRKASSWERIFNLKRADTAGPTAVDVNPYLVGMAPEDAAVVYLLETSSATMYYSNDSGETSWTLRACSVTSADPNAVDFAVESASFVYAVNSTGSVTKTDNSGFIWGGAKSTGLSNAATIVSLSEDNLIVGGGGGGGVAYSKDGNYSSDTWKKISGPAAGNTQVIASGLETDDYIYIGTSVVNDYIYRYKIGTSTSFSAISAQLAAQEYCSGIALVDSTLYALVADSVTPGPSLLYRSISPTATTVTFSTVSDTADFLATPQALVTSTGSVKLWAIDIDAAAAEESTTDTSTDELYSYEDTLTAAGPALAGPVDASTVAMNPVTGRAYDVAFSWDRVSKATKYDLSIALDSGFTQSVRSETALTSSATAVVFILGPYTAIPTTKGGSNAILEFMPETTYYWKVRVNSAGPIQSPYSEVRSFTVAPAVEPPVPPAPVLEPELLAPAAGATGISVFPTFAWSAVEGAVKYELEVAKDAAFAEKWVSKSGRNALTTTAYVSEQQLEYATTYYWRVDCYADGEWGNWVTGIFTTEAEPVTPAPEMYTCPLCGLEFPTQQALADHYAKYHAPAPTAAETPIYMWVIIGIGAILVITMIILIVRTRRAV